jgi:hypothetical protein
MRNTHREQIFSALPPNSDVARCGRYFAFVPIPEVASLFDHPVDAGAERRRKFERCRSAINLPRAQVTTYSNAAIASTTAARIGPASATSGRSCALNAPTHCPMITNLRIWPRTTTRLLCVRNFIQSHDRSIICTEADRTEVPRLTCDYPRTRTGIPTAHRSMTLKTVTIIITTECNFRGGIT